MPGLCRDQGAIDLHRLYAQLLRYHSAMLVPHPDVLAQEQDLTFGLLLKYLTMSEKQKKSLPLASINPLPLPELEKLWQQNPPMTRSMSFQGISHVLQF